MIQEEKVPDGEVFHGYVSWTRLEMETARNFEMLVDARLAALKQQVMQAYRDRRPPPFAIPVDDE